MLFSHPTRLRKNAAVVKPQEIGTAFDISIFNFLRRSYLIDSTTDKLILR
jgi:hypothetical protein